MIQLYHGSDYLFNRFAFVNVGKKSGTSGAGFGIYLTDNPEDACKYGKYIYTVQVQLQKELSNVKVSLKRDQLRTIIRKFEAIADNSYIENYEGLNPRYLSNEDKAIASLLKFNSCDVDIINDIINLTNCPVEMMQVLSNLGYTHTIDTKTPQDNITKNYIIFDLNCVRIVKREKTEDYFSNLMESYSIDENPFYEKLKNLNQFESGTKTGNQGKSKSKSQRRLFGMALAYKRGKLNAKYASPEIKKMADSMDQETLHNFAATKQKKRKKDGSIGKRNNIPDYVKGSDYRPHLKNSKSLKNKY